MNAEEMRVWIDQASYEQLLDKWRFAPWGDPFFRLEMGDYYAVVMAKKKAAIGHDAAVSASKSVGWDR